jgi:hypothetical protein
LGGIKMAWKIKILGPKKGVWRTFSKDVFKTKKEAEIKINYLIKGQGINEVFRIVKVK